MTGRYSATRPAGREHIPSMPKGFIAIRIVQLVIAVIVLALSGLTLSAWALRSNCLSTFTVSITPPEQTYSCFPPSIQPREFSPKVPSDIYTVSFLHLLMLGT